MKKFIAALALCLIATTSFAKVDPGGYIFAVVESEEGLKVFVNSLEYWKENGSLIDSYESEEADQFINDEMLAADLCNSMESTFEPCGKTFPKSEYIKTLEKRGFIHHKGFEHWIKTQL